MTKTSRSRGITGHSGEVNASAASAGSTYLTNGVHPANRVDQSAAWGALP